MNKYEMRRQIISYVSPHIRLFPTQYALVFGTRHGVDKFADDILGLYHRGYFKNLIISGGVTNQGSPPEAELILHAVVKKCRTCAGRTQRLGIEEILLIGKISSKTAIRHDCQKAMA